MNVCATLKMGRGALGVWMIEGLIQVIRVICTPKHLNYTLMETRFHLCSVDSTNWTAAMCQEKLANFPRTSVPSDTGLIPY